MAPPGTPAPASLIPSRLWPRGAMALAAAASLAMWSNGAEAIEISNVGDESLTIDISNTSVISYRFDNRNDVGVDEGATSLIPTQRVDDNYGEWLNRLYLRTYYWKFSLGVRLDSAVYFRTMDRQRAQDLIIEELGQANLDLETRFGRELHSRYTNMIFPSKLWLGFKHKWIEATLGDFYAQLGRGLVFSVRKIDEVGVDTTVRGAKVRFNFKADDWRIEATAFGGQMNPMRLDFPTGRVLHGSGSPMFFGFPETQDFRYFSAVNATDFELQTERAKPGYLEDNVVGGNVTFGPKQVKFGLNTAVLFRQSNSQQQEACLAEGTTSEDQCLADFPSFSNPDASRAHDRIANFSATIRVPPIEDTFDGFIEVAGQHHGNGRYNGVSQDEREQDLWGYAVYANLNLRAGPLAFTLEGKHYRSFFPLAANVDLVTPGFGAGEFSLITYSQPPTTESIYVQPINAPNLCITGGRARVDANLRDTNKVYAWVGHYASFTGIDPTNNRCETTREHENDLRSNITDIAAGGELNLQDGKTHYWAWIGARNIDRSVAEQSNPEIPGESTAFYREGYVRYDLQQHIAGDFSLTAFGFHRRRFEPDQQPVPWNAGENLLALNYNPHLAFIFGYEYQTQPGFPTHYFNGAIQWRAKNNEKWWGQVFDSARVFVGQRRAALRCVGGVCRVFPAFEGARLEIVSRF